MEHFVEMYPYIIHLGYFVGVPHVSWFISDMEDVIFLDRLEVDGVIFNLYDDRCQTHSFIVYVGTQDG